MKKTLCIIAAALALTLLASGILSGCDANNAASAANAGKNSAKKINTTVSRLENLDDKDFVFPSVFGNDFFLNETSTTAEDCPVGADSNPVNRRVNTEQGYHAKHFGNKQLNHQGDVRTRYLDKFDDLFVLCADISAANSKCNEITAAIKEEGAQLKQLSGELKKAGKKSKDTYATFNYNNRLLNESITKLNRDRNSIKSRVNANRRKGNTNSLDIEATTKHNLMVMNKIENRLRLLEDTHAKLVKMNQDIRASLGKVAAPTVNNPVESSNESTVPNVVTMPERSNIETPQSVPQVIGIEQQEEPQITVYRHPVREYHPRFRTNRNAYSDLQNSMKYSLENQTNQNQQQSDEQVQADTDKPVMVHRFRTLPYVFPCQ